VSRAAAAEKQGDLDKAISDVRQMEASGDAVLQDFAAPELERLALETEGRLRERETGGNNEGGAMYDDSMNTSPAARAPAPFVLDMGRVLQEFDRGGNSTNFSNVSGGNNKARALYDDSMNTSSAARCLDVSNLAITKGGLALCPFELASLPAETYLSVALHLDAHALCEVEATCRNLRVLRQSRLSPWHALGARKFRGIELVKDGIFDAAARLDWKEHYFRFQQRLPFFQLPFIGQEICQVLDRFTVAHCCCMLQADLLGKDSGIGVYIEFEVVANAGRVVLTVEDFEAGSERFLTFNPASGEISRERLVRECPRRSKGPSFNHWRCSQIVAS